MPTHWLDYIRLNCKRAGRSGFLIKYSECVKNNVFCSSFCSIQTNKGPAKQAVWTRKEHTKIDPHHKCQTNRNNHMFALCLVFCNVQRLLYSLHCKLYNMPSYAFSMKCTQCSEVTLFSVQRTVQLKRLLWNEVYSVQYKVKNELSSEVCSVQCVVYSVQCAVWRLLCELCTVFVWHNFDLKNVGPDKSEGTAYSWPYLLVIIMENKEL